MDGQTGTQSNRLFYTLKCSLLIGEIGPEVSL
jgi:hypothetical protein